MLSIRSIGRTLSRITCSSRSTIASLSFSCIASDDWTFSASFSARWPVASIA